MKHINLTNRSWGEGGFWGWFAKGNGWSWLMATLRGQWKVWIGLKTTEDGRYDFHNFFEFGELFGELWCKISWSFELLCLPLYRRMKWANKYGKNQSHDAMIKQESNNFKTCQTWDFSCHLGLARVWQGCNELSWVVLGLWMIETKSPSLYTIVSYFIWFYLHLNE